MVEVLHRDFRTELTGRENTPFILSRAIEFPTITSGTNTKNSWPMPGLCNMNIQNVKKYLDVIKRATALIESEFGGGSDPLDVIDEPTVDKPCQGMPAPRASLGEAQAEAGRSRGRSGSKGSPVQKHIDTLNGDYLLAGSCSLPSSLSKPQKRTKRTVLGLCSILY
jgi:hypothetical protein